MPDTEIGDGDTLVNESYLKAVLLVENIDVRGILCCNSIAATAGKYGCCGST